MAEVQDEDQWLYGDEKEDGKEDEEEEILQPMVQNGVANITQESTTTIEDKNKDKNDVASNDKQSETSPQDDGDKDDNDDEDADKDKDSSDEDDLTVTIGEVKKQSDIVADNIIQPTSHTNRFQPKAAPTSGLKDDDFNSAGKINGVAVGDFDMSDYEEKPWRKPGADLADYFNYGFVEDTWMKYCEKQKMMRLYESKSGLSGLGGILTKGSANISIINDNSKYIERKKVGIQVRPKASEPTKPEGNTIQVMTADRRVYSSKATLNYNNNDNMDFGGDIFSNTNNSTPYFNPDAPPPNFFSNPPPSFGGDTWTGTPPPTNWSNNSNVPITGLPDVTTVTSVPPPNYEEDSRGRRMSPDDDRHSILVPVIQEDQNKSRRSHYSTKSRSPTRHHRRSRSRSRSYSRSRSRSPSHRHKRKKSKRDRDE